MAGVDGCEAVSPVFDSAACFVVVMIGCDVVDGEFCWAVVSSLDMPVVVWIVLAKTLTEVGSPGFAVVSSVLPAV